MLKKILTIGVCLVSLNCYAENHNLSIVNNTMHASTMKINSIPFCSSSFGSWGVTPGPGRNEIPYDVIKKVCGFFGGDVHKCTAHIFMTNDCSGNEISTAIYDIDAGIISYTPPIEGYSVKPDADGFGYTMSGGPSA